MNQPSEKCEWHLHRDSFEPWIGTCGIHWIFQDGGPKDNDVNFCPNCGKPVEVVSDTDELEEEE